MKLQGGWINRQIRIGWMHTLVWEICFFLKITRDQFQPPKGTARSLTRRYEGPFQVKKWVGEVAYELELLHHMHMRHPIFHISQLKKCRLDAEHPDRVEPPRGPAMIVDRPNLVLEKILDLWTTRLRSNMRWEFLIRWKDALEERGWETKDSLWRWKKEIVEFNEGLVWSKGFMRMTMNLIQIGS